MPSKSSTVLPSHCLLLAGADRSAVCGLCVAGAYSSANGAVYGADGVAEYNSVGASAQFCSVLFYRGARLFVAACPLPEGLLLSLPLCSPYGYSIRMGALQCALLWSSLPGLWSSLPGPVRAHRSRSALCTGASSCAACAAGTYSNTTGACLYIGLSERALEMPHLLQTWRQ